ncbi:hypothetical protein D3C71_1828040 [compost metagenome]
MAGIEPTNNQPSKCKSTLPELICPKPATKVKSTACTTSDPIIRIMGKFGNISTNAIIPNAPAPTDDKVTNTPNTMPIMTI